MFQKSYFPDSYFPPGYFEKVLSGAVKKKGKVWAAGLYWWMLEEMERREAEEKKRLLMKKTNRNIVMKALAASEAEVLVREAANNTAMYATILCEV